MFREIATLIPETTNIQTKANALDSKKPLDWSSRRQLWFFFE
ncbi:hypothetical protein BGP_6453 [Beggiatoa sp. PS]|nr:hypothetical protein BGP_6453 [Beggiatoa sp. PS]